MLLEICSCVMPCDVPFSSLLVIGSIAFNQLVKGLFQKHRIEVGHCRKAKGQPEQQSPADRSFRVKGQRSAGSPCTPTPAP